MKKNYLTVALFLKGISFLILTLFFFSETTNGQPGPKSAKASTIPDSIHKIFEKSCMTCHSEGGKKIAMSHLNFSNWDKYNTEKQASKAHDICEMVSKGKMPPKAFRESKPELIPTADQIKDICQWSESFGKNNKN